MSWQQIGQAANGESIRALVHAEAMVEATDVSGSRTFALKVQDDTMEPSFREGEMIFVNPDAEWKPGDHVVVTRRDDGMTATVLRQVKEVGDRRMLHPLNWEYEDVPLAESDIVWGKVVRLRKNL
jgi:SOS-response transcriptional repressor LexA